MFNFSVDMCCVLALCVREREREREMPWGTAISIPDMWFFSVLSKHHD